MKTSPLILLLLIAISGCTTSKAIRTPVVDSISVEQARATKKTGDIVRWGGLVVGVENKKNHSIIEIVARPLTRLGVPKITNKTDGRFLAKSNQFLEPEDIKPGRYITVNGELTDYQSGQIGDYDYEYPLVTISEYKVWPVNNYYNNRFYNRYHSPYYYDPFWGHHSYYFRHHRRHHHYW